MCHDDALCQSHHPTEYRDRLILPNRDRFMLRNRAIETEFFLENSVSISVLALLFIRVP